MKNNEILNKNLKILKLDEALNEKLKEINIISLEELCNCKVAHLKENNFSNGEINQIKVKLQLVGLDLNRKKY